MTDPEVEDLIDELADDYVCRLQAGESPSVDEYCDRHPDIAAEIRELFATLAILEGAKPASPTSKKKLPETIGEYQVVGELGRGGMGVVYEAIHTTLGRRVALKVLPGNTSATSRARIRFQREARAAAKMHHTNIVPVFDVGEDGECFYYAMQLIEGRGLDRVVKELRNASSGLKADQLSSLNSDDGKSSDSHGSSTDPVQIRKGDSSGSSGKAFYRSVARIGLQVAEALAYAHARDVIHRDIKPSNLLMDHDGVVWVTDFGLVKTDDEGLTKTGDVIGTLRYMSPERFNGECDARSDTYALGLTLYELLVERPAFESTENLKVVELIRSADPDRPRSVDRRIPRDLETIVLKSIEKEPRARYKSARAMSQDLQRFISDEPIQARRASMAEQAIRWARRNKRLAAVTAAFISFLGIAAIGSTIAARHFQVIAAERALLAEENLSLAQDMETQRDVAVKAEASARVAENDAKQLRDLAQRRAETTANDLYAAEMILAAGDVDKPGGIRTVRQRIRKWIPREGETDRRGPEWSYLNGLGRENLLTLEGHNGPVVGAKFSPDGTYIVTAGEDRVIRLRDASSGNEIAVRPMSHEAPLTHVAFSPSGDQILTAGDDRIVRIWKIPSLELVAELEGHQKGVQCAEFSRDEKYIATGGGDGLRIWDGETHRPLHHILPSDSVPADDVDMVTDLDWHPNDNRLVSISSNDNMFVWNPKTGQRDLEFVWLNELPEMEFWYGNKSITWSPSGEKLFAVGVWNAILHLPSEKRSASAQVFEPEGGSVLAGAWTPDERCVITAGDSLELVYWDVETLKPMKRIRGHEGAVVDFDLSPDGKIIVSASRDGTARVWSSPKDGQEKLWAEGAVAVSPDSTRVALSGGTKNQLLIADLDSGDLVHEFSAPADSWIGFAEWSPESDRVAVAFGNGEANSMVYIWSVDTGDLLHSLDVGAAYIQSIAWHPTQEMIAVGQNAERPMEFWDTQSGNLVETQKYGAWIWNSLDWSSDGKRLAVAGWRPMVVDWESRRVIRTLNQPHTANSSGVCFSRDGTRLVTAGTDSLICIYDSTNWKHLRTLEGHAGPVFEVTANPEFTRIASIGADGALRIWNAETGKVVMNLDLGNAHPRSLQWSNDGRFIVVSANKHLRVFKMRP